ncbi:TPA: GspF family T2SS innner membrane protein variant LspF [Legionella pneumophila subsp. raphaeli]|uniref:GspF family T2SS innner membrane protein variant LspF n=1 Tax=Legionella pneumophila TaxID=446 RepID=UPI000786BAE0|nr:GspF family T2SS innner membrane protein variant LspF [Legionella pneumophila]HCO4737885.1 GspF family T2SS innner membrane protein variant LspF [Legionella pneumophila]HDU7928383.1 GspF family T2SS innner membrane protein variant LspF [Legionella pneumophila]HDU7934514.1 GspF family T2SS innner membrane protein variant LspF [Legionella pneumophila]HDU7963862.1 GspF family T2SS innner membrane protein variant LspF [Legionella pneumophila]HEG4428361.1 GspF family T2SS innner membrane protein
MGAYQYQALKVNGNVSKGVIEADSERHARQLLREQGLIPTQVQTLTQQRAASSKSKVSAADLALLTRQLATLLAAGIPVEESLRGVSEQTEKDKVRELIIGVRSKVLEGYGLAQAMAQYPNAFPELYRATVGSGEQTGRLDVVLEKLADYTEKQQKTRQKVQQALIYPLLMIIVSTAIISFLLTFVVPKIIDVFTESGQTLPPMTQLLINLSQFIKSYGLYTLAAIILALIGFKKSLSNIKIKTTWHQVILKLPIVSYLVKTINVARYIHTFGILFAAGVSVLETMRVSSSLVTNVVMRQAFDLATLRVREGSGISEALKETKFISPMAIHLIASGEKSGQLSDMMERSASHLDNEVNRLIETSLTLLEPMVILLMGAVVLFIVLATLLPIFSMEQLVA